MALFYCNRLNSWNSGRNSVNLLHLVIYKQHHELPIWNNVGKVNGR